MSQQKPTSQFMFHSAQSMSTTSYISPYSHVSTQSEPEDMPFSPSGSSVSGVVAEPVDFINDQDLNQVLLVSDIAAVEHIIHNQFLYKDVPYSSTPEDLLKVLGHGPTSSKINVRFIRKVLPALRVITCMKKLEFDGKRKIKGLWANKPESWPEGLPHKDPNNAERSPADGGSTPKANGNELKAMFRYLKEKFYEMVMNLLQQLTPEDFARIEEERQRKMAPVQPSGEEGRKAAIPIPVNNYTADNCGRMSMEHETTALMPSNSQRAYTYYVQPTESGHFTFSQLLDGTIVQGTVIETDLPEVYEEVIQDHGSQEMEDIVEEVVITQAETGDVTSTTAPEPDAPRARSAQEQTYIQIQLDASKEKIKQIFNKCLGSPIVGKLSDSFNVLTRLGEQGEMERFINAHHSLSSILDLILCGLLTEDDSMAKLSQLIDNFHENEAVTPSTPAPTPVSSSQHGPRLTINLPDKHNAPSTTLDGCQSPGDRTPGTVNCNQQQVSMIAPALLPQGSNQGYDHLGIRYHSGNLANATDALLHVVKMTEGVDTRGEQLGCDEKGKLLKEEKVLEDVLDFEEERFQSPIVNDVYLRTVPEQHQNQVAVPPRQQPPTQDRPPPQCNEQPPRLTFPQHVGQQVQPLRLENPYMFPINMGEDEDEDDLMDYI